MINRSTQLPEEMPAAERARQNIEYALTKNLKKPSGFAATVSRNVVISLARVIVNTLVALVLPAYLTHRLPVATYGAWALILQLSAFVSFLDFGVQTGVAKFVAEYEALGNDVEAGRHASAGLIIMIFAGLSGVVVTLLLAWEVPHLFRDMPPALYHDVRVSVLLVGSSLSFTLICTVFSAVFVGLQRYAVPVLTAVLNRALYTLAVCTAVFFHGNLATMGLVVALINVSTGLVQIYLWHTRAGKIKISLDGVSAIILTKMFKYCLVLAIWSAALLCVSGLDVTIVGHYAFRETGYYSLATLPANLIAVIIGSALGPLMPAASALSTQRTPGDMGVLLLQISRYASILILLTGLPLLVAGYPILRLWVGPAYALHSVRYLQILVLAMMIRNICLPYATLVVATGKQKVATIATIAEAVVNLGSSIYLVSTMGAIGVALGTLIGAFVSVAMHFALSMKYTYSAIAITRMRLFSGALLRSSTILIASLFFYRVWWRSPDQPVSPSLWLLWFIATALTAWFGALNPAEQAKLLQIALRRRA